MRNIVALHCRLGLLWKGIHSQPSCMWKLHVKGFVQMQSLSFVTVQLQSQIISILPTAQGVMSVKLNSSIQGFMSKTLGRPQNGLQENTLVSIQATSSFPVVEDWGTWEETERTLKLICSWTQDDFKCQEGTLVVLCALSCHFNTKALELYTWLQLFFFWLFSPHLCLSLKKSEMYFRIYLVFFTTWATNR